MRSPFPFSPRPESDSAGGHDRPGTQLVCLALALAVLVLAARIVSIL
jgi:MYXO-CTERM domain-containing protein